MTTETPPSARAGPPVLAAGRYVCGARVSTRDGVAIHLADDRRLHRRVVVHLADDRDPETRSRFDRDNRVLGRLDEPAFPKVFDIGRDGTTSYLVTEVVEGATLLDTRRACGAFAIEDAIAVVASVARALTAAGAAGCAVATPRLDDVVLTEWGPRFRLPPTAATSTSRTELAAGIAALLDELVRDPGRGSRPATRDDTTRDDTISTAVVPPSSPAEVTALLPQIGPSDLPGRIPGPPPDELARRRRPSGGRPLGFAARLTITNALILAAALCIVAALAVQLTRAHLERELDSHLTATAASFRNGPASEVDTAGQLPDAARRWLAALPQPADQVVVVRTDDGQVISTSSQLDLRALPGSSDLLESPEGRFWTVHDGDLDVRALSVPLSLDGEPAGTLVAAASTHDIDQRVADLTRWILVAAAAGFALAVALAVVAVRRAVRPLARMAEQVDAIQAANDLGQRVEHEGPLDEVGRLAEAFNRTLARLEAVFGAQRRFLTDASHELRTPLTVARGQLELLQHPRADSGEDPDADVRLAIEELDRMARIVDDLLLLARLDEGLTLQHTPVDVELVVREALLRTLPRSGVATTVDIPAGLQASADGDRLLQVFTNLLENALRHGGGDVQLTVRAREDTARSQVAIDISDTGPGIPADELALIFDRFYRGASSRAASTGGSGLGLAIVRSLTERMGGEVTARSGERGTTFTVRLPAVSPQHEPEAAPSRTAQASRHIDM